MSINPTEFGPDGLLFYTWMLSKEMNIINQNTEGNANEQ